MASISVYAVICPDCHGRMYVDHVICQKCCGDGRILIPEYPSRPLTRRERVMRIGICVGLVILVVVAHLVTR
jgi:hypothetical protein